MKKFKRQFVEGEYGQIHLRILRPENATKRPLVCLHMLPQSGRNFEAFLNSANDERIIIAPDFPGYGESDKPPTQITASDYARSVWTAIDATGLLQSHGRVDLFGIHAGAKLATEVARQRPDEIASLILAAAAVLTPDEMKQLKKAFFPVPLDERGTRFRKLWDILVQNQGKDQTLETLADNLSEILRPGDEYEWGHHSVYEFNHVFPEVLSSLPHPIALLNPKDDLYKMTPRTEPYIQNGRLYDYPNWDQGFIEANATEVFQEVNQLLNQLSTQHSNVTEQAY